MNNIAIKGVILITTLFFSVLAAAEKLKGEETRPGTMCTGPADMDPDTDYRYGECSVVCRGKDIILVDGIWDCTGSFGKLQMEIDLPGDDAGSDNINLVIPVTAIQNLLNSRVKRVQNAPAERAKGK